MPERETRYLNSGPPKKRVGARSRCGRVSGERLGAGGLGGGGGGWLRGVWSGCGAVLARESAGKGMGAENKNGKSSPLSEHFVSENSTFLRWL